MVTGLQRIHQAGERLIPRRRQPTTEAEKKEKQMADDAAQPKVAAR